jgi:hypothetical protein
MTRSLGRPTWFAIVLFLAAACSGGSSTPSPASPASPTAGPASPSPSTVVEPSASPAVTDAPSVEIAASLTFTEESAAAAEATIVAAHGGTIQATAADGTTFSLEVPAGALLEDTLITMTPLAGVQGVGDAAAHAVRLEPDGLTFLEFARLTIAPTTPVPVDAQVMFQATGKGDGVTAAAVDVESDDVVLLVDHFSIAGVGSAQGRAVWLIDRAIAAEQRISHEIGKVLQEQRRQQLAGKDEPMPLDELKTLFGQVDAEVLRPLREASVLTCSGAVAYVQALLRIERQRQLIGLGDDDTYSAAITEATRVIEASYKMCEREAIQQCSVKPEPEILVRFWISWDRQRDFLGLEPLNPDIDALPERATNICRGAYQFHFSGSGTATQFGHAEPIDWEYWGLACSKDEPWQIWERFDGIQQNSGTGPPDGDPYGPIEARFDENGEIVESSWAPLGNLLGSGLGGTLQGTVYLQLIPGEAPTELSVTIREGDGPPTTFTEEVVPFDGSFGECPEQSGAAG